MKKNRLSLLARVVVFLCGIALFVVLFVPMWEIQLGAPQYPEGLVLLIYPNKLAGNVDIINGLNHYIGMQKLRTEDFMEFTTLPWIIGFFAIAFVLTAIIGNRRLLWIMFLLMVGFGIVAMWDFWKWEYNYGHNLNPDAAIIVPGMAYQPPLIGFKQLLNFQAYSIPALGGWLFIAVGVVLATLLGIDWYHSSKRKRLQTASAAKAAAASLMLLLSTHLSSCSEGPQPIVVGRDNCENCKMMVSDPRFGGEIITKKGKVYKFDDIHCILSFLDSGRLDRKEVAAVYLTDFSSSHQLINSENAFLLRSDALRAPMGGNTAAFSNADSLKMVAGSMGGKNLQWDEIFKQ